VQRAELAVRIPPARSELAEFLQFGRVDVHDSFSQKKAPPKRGLFRSGARIYWLELEEPLLVPVAPVAEGAVRVLAVLSRLPRSSASTRRSGCRQEISFWFLLLSLPMRWHWLPVTGSDSPLPSTCRRLDSTPLDAR